MGRKTYAATRLNWSATGWGVVDKTTGALVRLNGGLAVRLTEAQADEVAARRNVAAVKRAESRANGAAQNGAARARPSVADSLQKSKIEQKSSA